VNEIVLLNEQIIGHDVKFVHLKIFIIEQVYESGIQINRRNLAVRANRFTEPLGY